MRATSQLRERLDGFGMRAALLALLLCALDAHALRASFVWDDFANVSVARMTTAGDAFLPGPERMQNGLYRPVSQMSAIADAKVWGDRAGGWHLTNLLLHGGVLVAVAFLLRRLGLAPVLALAATAVIGVHPAAADVVWWISARNDSLATLFGSIALLYALRENGDTRLNAWLCALFVFVALLCKESAVMWLPLALAVSGKRRGGLALPVVLAAAAYATLRFTALRSGTVPVSPGAAGVPVVAWLGASGFYVRQALAPFWFRPLVTGVPPSPLFPIAGALALAGTGLLFMRAIRSERLRVPALGVAWCWLALVPAILTAANPVSTTALADRHLYAGLPGLALFFAWTVPRVPIRARLPILLVVLSTFALLSQVRGRAWSDGLTLWTKIARDEPHSRYALANLAGERVAIGDRRGYVELLERAVASPEPGDFLRAEVTLDLAGAYLDENRLDDAVRLVGTLTSVPNDADAIVRFLVVKGRIALMRARLQPEQSEALLREAHESFQRAAAIGAGSPGLRYYEGLVFERIGERVDAMSAYRKATLDESVLAELAKGRLATLEAAVAAETNADVRAYEQARRAHLAGRPQEALPAYRELAAKPGSALRERARLRVAECVRQLGLPTE